MVIRRRDRLGSAEYGADVLHPLLGSGRLPPAVRIAGGYTAQQVQRRYDYGEEDVQLRQLHRPGGVFTFDSVRLFHGASHCLHHHHRGHRWIPNVLVSSIYTHQ